MRISDEVQYDLDTSVGCRMSDLHYVCLKFTNKAKNRSEEFSIILKRPVQLEIARERTFSDAQFSNEILFYQMYARPNENFARCFYADERPPANSVITLENVTEREYLLCTRAYDPPLEYTLAAMRELGRFHGKGYVTRRSCSENNFLILWNVHKRSDTPQRALGGSFSTKARHDRWNIVVVTAAMRLFVTRWKVYSRMSSTE